MEWLNDIKVSTKLMAGFVIVALIAGIIGYFGISKIKTVNKSDTELYENMARPLAWAGGISSYFQLVRVNSRDIIAAENPGEIEKFAGEIKACRDSITSLGDRLEKSIDSPDMQSVWESVKAARVGYGRDLDRLVQLAKENKDQEALALLRGPMKETAAAEHKAINKLVAMKESDARAKSEANTDMAGSAENAMILFILGGFIIAIGFGYFISKGISVPLSRLEDAANIIAGGNMDHSNDYLLAIARWKNEIGGLTNAVIKMKDAVVDKSFWLESILNNIPLPIHVVDTDMNWLFFNTATEELIGKKFADWKGKPCYNWGAVLCNTDKCSIKCMLAGKEVPEFQQGGKDWEIKAAKILDRNNQHVGSLEIVLDTTKYKEEEKYLAKNARNLLDKMTSFADGDLTVSVEKEKDDLVGELIEGFNRSVRQLNVLISDITEATNATASAANEISSSSEQMAAGTQEQSQQALEVASAVEEMTKTILDSNKNANRAAENAKIASQSAEDGAHKVENTQAGMKRIVESARQTEQKITSLAQKSEQIGQITQVIDDIADQTNLLALNAAIEAARAGEQGRGFAVVADEVRKLAERTTKATKEIATTIKSIQLESKEANDAMLVSGKDVQEGMHYTEEVAGSLKDILEASKTVSDIINQVAAASEEQSSAAEQISKNIEGISSVTHETASGTEQIAKAAEDLNNLTVKLQDLTSRFRIDVGGGFNPNTQMISERRKKLLNSGR